MLENGISGTQHDYAYLHGDERTILNCYRTQLKTNLIILMLVCRFRLCLHYNIHALKSIREQPWSSGTVSSAHDIQIGIILPTSSEASSGRYRPLQWMPILRSYCQFLGDENPRWYDTTDRQRAGDDCTTHLWSAASPVALQHCSPDLQTYQISYVIFWLSPPIPCLR